MDDKKETNSVLVAIPDSRRCQLGYQPLQTDPQRLCPVFDAERRQTY